ncbi:MAG: HNH endonuclease signature motif containing protein [Acidimicrobiales bacterium]
MNLERRFYQSSKDLDGNFHLAGRLDPVNGEIFDQLVSKRAAEFFDADWAKAVAEAAPGEVITKSMLRRSDRQRRLDALVSLVVDGSSTPEGAQRPEPSIIFGLDVLSLSEFIAQMLHADLGDWAPDTDTAGAAAADANAAGHADAAAGERTAASAAAGEASGDTAPPADNGTEESGGSAKSASDLNDDAATGNAGNGSDAAANGRAADNEPATNPTAASPSGGLYLPDPPYPVPSGPSTAAAVDPMRRCETLRGTPIPFRIMLQHLFEARIRRIVYTAPNIIINAGQSRRLFTTTQKQLIKFRDRCCTFPGCHRDAIYCEADHLRAFVDGGPTDLTNGQCLCRYHHNLKTRAKFYCEPLPDGTVGFFLPTGIKLE